MTQQILDEIRLVHKMIQSTNANCIIIKKAFDNATEAIQNDNHKDEAKTQALNKDIRIRRRVSCEVIEGSGQVRDALLALLGHLTLEYEALGGDMDQMKII